VSVRFLADRGFADIKLMRYSREDVLRQELGTDIDAIQAKLSRHLPIVLSKVEVKVPLAIRVCDPFPR
jgi:hypothetical protein